MNEEKRKLGFYGKLFAGLFGAFCVGGIIFGFLAIQGTEPTTDSEASLAEPTPTPLSDRDRSMLEKEKQIEYFTSRSFTVLSIFIYNESQGNSSYPVYRITLGTAEGLTQDPKIRKTFVIESAHAYELFYRVLNWDLCVNDSITFEREDVASSYSEISKPVLMSVKPKIHGVTDNDAITP